MPKFVEKIKIFSKKVMKIVLIYERKKFVRVSAQILCPGRLQMVITFFLLGFYGHKKFWEDKSIHSVGFQNCFGSLSVSQLSLSVSGQKVYFLP